MTRAYGRIACWVCGKPHSTNGLATVNHMRKHVREGKVVERFTGVHLELGLYGYYTYTLVTS